VIEKSRSVGDGLVPGLDYGEVDFVGLNVGLDATGGFDGVIEDGKAQAEAFGFGAADVVVLDRGEASEFGEGGGVGFGGGDDDGTARNGGDRFGHVGG
jgi:hypothetical protein